MECWTDVGVAAGSPFALDLGTALAVVAEIIDTWVLLVEILR